ncbi:hypothetical protein TrVE_jg8860 [Triparma verrucosa]|uniref:Thioredoxin domain-containing protein n=2 Tax=Triparma TaxID=722752 RepID=A0A9W7AFW3_9STRA|nr:hypothetical protein TrST_g2300 [Triparma strigata]GMH98774.1 hypothetical protein TrVE_jg8860 [Triparma verrucosa]
MRVILLLVALSQAAAFILPRSPLSVHRGSPLAAALYAKTKFKNFEEMLEKFEEPLLVDFYATWCGPCQLMSKELVTVGSTMSGQVKVAKVDTDKYPNLGDKYDVEGLPTCILFKGGKPVHRMIGLLKADQIKAEIAPFL